MTANQDAARGAADLLVKTGSLPWCALGDGLDYKLLWYSAETGAWTILLRMEKGAVIQRHKHLAGGDFYVLQGSFAYRAGTARAGDFGYEPNGVLHEKTTALEETVYTFHSYGPVAILNEDDTLDLMLDWEFFRDREKDPA